MVWHSVQTPVSLPSLLPSHLRADLAPMLMHEPAKPAKALSMMHATLLTASPKACHMQGDPPGHMSLLCASSSSSGCWVTHKSQLLLQTFCSSSSRCCRPSVLPHCRCCCRRRCCCWCCHLPVCHWHPAARDKVPSSPVLVYDDRTDAAAG